MRVAPDDYDIDGRPTVVDDPLLRRLYRVHKAPRPDLHWHARAPETRAGTDAVSRGRKEGHVTDVPKAQ